jgi:hypothetical protein
LHDLLSPLMIWAQDHSVLLLKTSFSGFLTRLQKQKDPDDEDGRTAEASLPAKLPDEGEKSSAAHDCGSQSYQVKQPVDQRTSAVDSLNSQRAAEDECAASTSAAGGTHPIPQPASQPQSDGAQAGMHTHCSTLTSRACDSKSKG